MTKLDRRCRNNPDTYGCIETAKSKSDKEIISKTYEIANKKLISFRTDKVSKPVSEERRAEMAEALRKWREKQKAERT